jgi:hypothetical protein
VRRASDFHAAEPGFAVSLAEQRKSVHKNPKVLRPNSSAGHPAWRVRTSQYALRIAGDLSKSSSSPAWCSHSFRTGFAGEAIQDKACAYIELEVIEVESGEFVVDPRVHSSVSKLRKMEYGQDRERGFPNAGSEPALGS